MPGDRITDSLSALIETTAPGGDILPDQTAPKGDPSLFSVLWQDAEAAMIVLDADQRLCRVNPAAQDAMARWGITVGDPVDAGDFARRFGADEAPPAQPVRLEDGTAGSLLTWHDVGGGTCADRRRSELYRLGQLVEGASDYAIIMLDPEGRVETWSNAAERMQGYSNAEAVGMSYESFFDDGDQAAGLPGKILKRAVAEGKVQVEGKRVRADGSVFWAHAALTAMHDEEGGLRGFVKVTHDVSERRATERAVVELNELLEERVAERTVQLEQQAADLAAANAELEAFSYSVSHDLRAPLRAMSGFARIIEQEHGEHMPAEALGYLARVTENAQAMGNLIDALLQFSRLQRQQMQQAPIDMTKLVRECWTALTPARGDRRITFELARLPPALGDLQLIRQVWMNLLDNAIKYSSRQAEARVEVSVELAEDGSMATYMVRDNGAGFDMRYAEKIGQVFQRLHHQEEFAGTGIGLALVQRIVLRHGGQLTAIGEPGEGARFGFSLRAVS